MATAQSAWTSHVPQVSALMLKAIDSGLQTAAALYRDEMERRLQKGFTSGDFTQQVLSHSVNVGKPEWRDGKRWIAIGTPYIYALYWEMGHLNLFTADYEHVPKWVPTLEEMAGELRAAFTEAAQRVLRGGAPSVHVDVAAD